MTQTFPPEWRTFVDEATGIQICQWTNREAMNHHFYFTNPPISPGGGEGYFVSYRNGYPNLFAIDLGSGELRQVTDRDDINPFSPARSPVEPRLFFSAQHRVWGVDLATGAEEVIAEFPRSTLGNCSLSPDDAMLAIGVRRETGCALALIEVAARQAEIVAECPEVGHIQFCRSNPDLLEFSGPVDQRVWVFDRRTGECRWVYRQTWEEWIVHETWLGQTDEIVFPRWPFGVYGIRADGTGLRTICEINAWHLCSSLDGRWLAADTNHPNRGILLIDPETGDWRVLCEDQASCRGTQWTQTVPAQGAGIDVSIIRGANPAADRPPHPDDPASTYGPQWTHPHPAFSPDGRTLVFTSDRFRWSQVFSVAVPE